MFAIKCVRDRDSSPIPGDQGNASLKGGLLENAVKSIVVVDEDHTKLLKRRYDYSVL